MSKEWKSVKKNVHNATTKYIYIYIYYII
jgi:hypothetical protein